MLLGFIESALYTSQRIRRSRVAKVSTFPLSRDKVFTITTVPPVGPLDLTPVSLIRLGAATHGFDQDQRFLDLSFTNTSGKLTVAAPAHAYLAPPGYYMLFILDDGVPSIARIVKLK